MVKTALIGGSGFMSESFLKEWEQEIVNTHYGNVLLFKKGKNVFLPRHGKANAIAPHTINHRANICAINMQGIERIFSINSVGSLKETIKPGSLVIPHDYVHFRPPTFNDFDIISITPELNAGLIRELKAVTKKLKLDTKNTGIYIQTKGPRFETKAEIAIIKKWGTIVGMTLASEATLAQELGISYAGICHIDNYAHGISKKPLVQKNLETIHKKLQPSLIKLAKELVK